MTIQILTATKSDMCETFASPDVGLCVKNSRMIAGLSLKSASKTTKLLGMSALVVAIAATFAGCFASSDDTDEQGNYIGNQNSLPHTVRTCPGDPSKGIMSACM